MAEGPTLPRAGQPYVDAAIGTRPRECGLNARRGEGAHHEKFKTLPPQRSKPFGGEHWGGPVDDGARGPEAGVIDQRAPPAAKTSASTPPLVPVFR